MYRSTASYRGTGTYTCSSGAASRGGIIIGSARRTASHRAGTNTLVNQQTRSSAMNARGGRARIAPSAQSTPPVTHDDVMAAVYAAQRRRESRPANVPVQRQAQQQGARARVAAAQTQEERAAMRRQASQATMRRAFMVPIATIFAMGGGLLLLIYTIKAFMWVNANVFPLQYCLYATLPCIIAGIWVLQKNQRGEGNPMEAHSWVFGRGNQRRVAHRQPLTAEQRDRQWRARNPREAFMRDIMADEGEPEMDDIARECHEATTRVPVPAAIPTVVVEGVTLDSCSNPLAGAQSTVRAGQAVGDLQDASEPGPRSLVGSAPEATLEIEKLRQALAESESRNAALQEELSDSRSAGTSAHAAPADEFTAMQADDLPTAPPTMAESAQRSAPEHHEAVTDEL
jgi:hypothetical protein